LINERVSRWSIFPLLSERILLSCIQFLIFLRRLRDLALRIRLQWFLQNLPLLLLHLLHQLFLRLPLLLLILLIGPVVERTEYTIADRLRVSTRQELFAQLVERVFAQLEVVRRRRATQQLPRLVATVLVLIAGCDAQKVFQIDPAVHVVVEDVEKGVYVVSHVTWPFLFAKQMCPKAFAVLVKFSVGNALPSFEVTKKFSNGYLRTNVNLIFFSQ